MASLSVRFALPLRHYRLELALEVEGVVALVGPSGAGKSIDPQRRSPGSSGRRAAASASERRSGRTPIEASSSPPDRRRVGFVFQEYALFPHMSVRQNVAYGGRSPRRRVAASGSRSPVSRQRGQTSSPAANASVSRSPARSPATRECCLLDEPLSALDAAHEGICARRARATTRRVRPADADRHARLRGRGNHRRSRGRRRRRTTPPARHAR